MPFFGTSPSLDGMGRFMLPSQIPIQSQYLRQSYIETRILHPVFANNKSRSSKCRNTASFLKILSAATSCPTNIMVSNTIEQISRTATVHKAGST